MENETYPPRAEHLAWCKQRALACLPADPANALTSMISDLGKHPETVDHIGIRLTVALMAFGNLQTAEQARRHIEGFN